MELIPYLVVTASIYHINQSGTSIAKLLQVCSNLNNSFLVSVIENRKFLL